MPQQPDEEQRIARLRADLLDLGLEWNNHYRLHDTGREWGLDFMRPTTAQQHEQALQSLQARMNS